MENSIKKLKRKRAKFVRIGPFDQLVKNFGRNTMSPFLLLNLLIVYLLAQEKNGKFFQKKKRFVKFCPEVPLVPTGQEFRPECNFFVFAPKPADSIFCGSKRKWKILSKGKKIRVNFVQKCPKFRLVRNFNRNATSPFSNENM